MLSVRNLFLISLLIVPACTLNSSTQVYNPATDSLRFPGEVHLRNLRQLTFGGNNAEAYWSYDDRYLVFQSDWAAINPQGCDQIFLMRADGQPLADGQRYRMLSTGKGRTTCAYFLPDGRVLYASTHAHSPECPPIHRSAEGRYVWSLYEYDIYITDTTGAAPELLIGGPGYDAEATVSPDGRYVVFTSSRSGDLELWRYDLQTGELLQLTHELGYDGGAFFSPDGNKIVWRASRPKGQDAERYWRLLAQGLVEPSEMDLYVAQADGSNPRRVVSLPGAQWAPYFHPDGERIIFASNHHTEGGRLFDLFLIRLDGSGLEQVTHSGTFDAFPMFSRDGKRLIFASNRNVRGEPSQETNLFVADWVEHPESVDLNFRRP